MTKVSALLVTASVLWVIVYWCAMQASRAGHFSAQTTLGLPFFFAAVSILTVMLCALGCFVEKRITGHLLLAVSMIHVIVIGLSHLWLNEVLYVA